MQNTRIVNNKYWINAEVADYSECYDNGYWFCGRWHGGSWLNGKWNNGLICINLSFLPKISKVSPKSFHKPKRTLSLNYAKYK